MNRIGCLLLLLLIASSACQAVTYAELQTWVSRAASQPVRLLAEESPYQQPADARGAMESIGNVAIVEKGSRNFQVDLSWAKGVSRAIERESSTRLRAQYRDAFLDTMSGLLRDIADDAARPAREFHTREQMLDALRRAENYTSVLPEDLDYANLREGGVAVRSYGRCIGGFDGQLIAYRAQGDSQSYVVGSGGNPGGGSGGGYSGGSTSGGGGSSGGGSSVAGGSGSGGSGYGRSSGQGSSGQGNPTTSGSSYNPGHTYAGGSSTGSRARPGSTVNTTYRPPAPPKVTPPPPKPAPTPPPPPKPPEQKKEAGFFQGFTKILYWAMFGLTAIVFLAIMVFIYLTYRTQAADMDVKAVVGSGPIAEHIAEANSLSDQASRLAGEGRFEEAIRLLTMSSLLLLEERRVLDFQDSCTNGELLAQLAEQRAAQGEAEKGAAPGAARPGRGNLQDILREPLRLFDRMVYGFVPAAKPDYEVFRALFQKLQGGTR